MPMLPAIPSGSPTAPAHPGKGSERAAKGAFQSVLEREAGPSAPAESAPETFTPPAEAPATGSDTTPEAGQRPVRSDEESPNQDDQASLAAMQNIAPQVTETAEKPLPPTPQSPEQTIASSAVVIDPADPAAHIVPSLPDSEGQQTATKDVVRPTAQSQANPAPADLSAAAADQQQPAPVPQAASAPINQAAAPTETAGTHQGAAAPPGSAPAPATPSVPTPAPTAGASASSVASGAVYTDRQPPQAAPQAEAAPATASADSEQPEGSQPSGDQAIPETASRTEPAAGRNAAPAPSREVLGDERFTQLLDRRHGAAAVQVVEPSASTAAATAVPVAGQQGNVAAFLGPQVNPAIGRQPQRTPDHRLETSVTAGPGHATTAQEGTATLFAAEPGPMSGDATGAQLPASQAAGRPILENGILPESDGQSAAAWPESQEPGAGAAGVFSQPGSQASTGAPQGPSLPHTSAFAVPEQEVMEQIIQRSSLQELDGKRHLTVELHPEELGQVKLDLVQENNRLQLHLQAQNGEVRDILQKHLPRLQEALQQQGLRLDDIQVSVDAQSSNAQGFFEQRQQQARRNVWQNHRTASLPDQVQPAAARATNQTTARGLSLRI